MKRISADGYEEILGLSYEVEGEVILPDIGLLEEETDEFINALKELRVLCCDGFCGYDYRVDDDDLEYFGDVCLDDEIKPILNGKISFWYNADSESSAHAIRNGIAALSDDYGMKSSICISIQ